MRLPPWWTILPLLMLLASAVQAQNAPTEQIFVTKTIEIPDLSNPAHWQVFEVEERKACGSSRNVVERGTESDSPQGTFVSQSIPANTRVKCTPQIIVYVSNGPPPSPVQYPSTTGNKQPETPVLYVPSLKDPAARQAFSDRASEFCKATYIIHEVRRADSSDSGTFLDQSIEPGTVFNCADQITVGISSGPPIVPPPPPKLIVGDLSDPNNITALENQASQLCNSPYQVARRTRYSSRPAGAFDGQMPAAGAMFECGMNATVWTSDGPPLPLGPPGWVYWVSGTVLILFFAGILKSLKWWPFQTIFGIKKGVCKRSEPRFGVQPSRAEPDIQIDARISGSPEANVITETLFYTESQND